MSVKNVENEPEFQLGVVVIQAVTDWFTTQGLVMDFEHLEFVRTTLRDLADTLPVPPADQDLNSN